MKERIEAVGNVIILILAFAILFLLLEGVEIGIRKYKGHRDKSKMMEIYEIRDKIAQTRQNLAKDLSVLEELRDPPLGLYDGATYTRQRDLVESERWYLCHLVYQHNKWQLRHNGFLIGTPLFDKLLIECSV